MKKEYAIFYCSDYNGFKGYWWMDKTDAKERNNLRKKEIYKFVSEGKRRPCSTIIWGNNGEQYEIFPDNSLKNLS